MNDSFDKLTAMELVQQAIEDPKASIEELGKAVVRAAAFQFVEGDPEPVMAAGKFLEGLGAYVDASRGDSDEDALAEWFGADDDEGAMVENEEGTPAAARGGAG